MCELRKSGLKLKVHEQPFQVLAALLERPGEVVTREELSRKLWRADTFVDFDHSLNTAVNKVREALGDSADHPRYIETVPRRGYRFLAPVNGREAPAPTRHTVMYWSAAAAALLLAMVGLGLWLFLRGSKAAGPPVRVTPLTSYTGRQCCSSFSPDGNQVAFVWNSDIYVKLVGTEDALRLTSDQAVKYNPGWSPDGRRIAFLRDLPGGGVGVFLIPAIGGPERKLAETDAPGLGLSWFPDGKWLAVPRRDGIHLVSVETGEKRRLTFPPTGPTPDRTDEAPAFSPDGRYLAFSRHGEIYLLALSESLSPREEPRQLTFKHLWSTWPAWTADGREIIFSCGPGDNKLWRMPVSGAAPPQLLFADVQGSWPSISRRGDRLAYTRVLSDQNIWRVEIPWTNRKAGEPVNVISSTYSEDSPQYSPDGKRIAFTSSRSGTTEIWVSNSDGSGAVQLTSMGAVVTGSPHWSPDGRRIVFDSNLEVQYEIYTIDASGGAPRRMTNHPAQDAVASFSRDGRWIYFSSNRTKEWQIWKMPAEGGEAAQVTRHGGRIALESFDGKSVYFMKDSQPASMWRVAVDGGEEEEIKIPESVNPSNFALGKQGIYFVVEHPDGRSALQFHAFATGKVTMIAAIRRPVGWGLSVSPDERHVLYTQADQEGSDLMLAENFR